MTRFQTVFVGRTALVTAARRQALILSGSPFLGRRRCRGLLHVFQARSDRLLCCHLFSKRRTLCMPPWYSAPSAASSATSASCARKSATSRSPGLLDWTQQELADASHARTSESRRFVSLRVEASRGDRCPATSVRESRIEFIEERREWWWSGPATAKVPN